MNKGNKISVLRKQEVSKKFAFLVHFVENWNWLLVRPCGKHLHQHPEDIKKYWKWTPVYHLMSLIYFFRRVCFYKLDDFDFNDKVRGITCIVPHMAWHFFVRPRKVRQKIVKSVEKIQDKEEVDVIGLGALTKHEGLTQGGKYIVDRLGERLKVPLVHGDTLTAVTVIKMIEKIFHGYPDTPVFMTGATSKIGRAVALFLARQGVRVKMFTSSPARFQQIRDEAGENGHYLERVENLEDGQECYLWLTGKAKPGGATLLQYIPHEGVVLNFSVPNALSAKTLRKENRRDVFAGDVGFVAYDPQKTDLECTMRLWPGITYACHAGTAVHAWMGWNNHEVGPVEVDQMETVWNAAEQIGFFLPDPGDLALLDNWKNHPVSDRGDLTHVTSSP